MPTDYVGDVQTAMERYDDLGPGAAAIKIDSDDTHSGRYGVLLWNIYGKWEASETTLAESVHRAIDRGIIDRFGFDEAEWLKIAGRAKAKAAYRRASSPERPE